MTNPYLWQVIGGHYCSKFRQSPVLKVFLVIYSVTKDLDYLWVLTEWLHLVLGGFGHGWLLVVRGASEWLHLVMDGNVWLRTVIIVCYDVVIDTYAN